MHKVAEKEIHRKHILILIRHMVKETHYDFTK